MRNGSVTTKVLFFISGGFPVLGFTITKNVSVASIEGEALITQDTVIVTLFV